MDGKVYLIEFLSGMAFLSPRKSRVLTFLEEFNPKSDTLTEEESFELAKHHSSFGIRLRLNLAGAIFALILLFVGFSLMVIGAVTNSALALVGIALVVFLIIVQFTTAFILRKTHMSVMKPRRK